MKPLYTTYMESPLGWIRLDATEEFLCGCRWVKEPDVSIPLAPEHPVLQETVRQLNEYFSGQRTSFDLPLQQQGTTYQQTVWKELEKIPYGETISYKELATRGGNPKGCRAAGSANGKNNLFILVPCHRVVQSNGTPGGFAYGTEMKQFLLNLEAAIAGR